MTHPANKVSNGLVFCAGVARYQVVGARLKVARSGEFSWIKITNAVAVAVMVSTADHRDQGHK